MFVVVIIIILNLGAPFNEMFTTFYNDNIDFFSNINCVSFDFINNNIIELIFDINLNKINNLIK